MHLSLYLAPKNDSLQDEQRVKLHSQLQRWSASRQAAFTEGVGAVIINKLFFHPVTVIYKIFTPFSNLFMHLLLLIL